jgi:hypothetical protein
MYMRIGKTIADKRRFSRKELEGALMEDWNEDLVNFGGADASSTPGRSSYLTHSQYMDSLYQLVDEWCGGIESSELYHLRVIVIMIGTLD